MRAKAVSDDILATTDETDERLLDVELLVTLKSF